ncbi:acyltransferase family protein [Burkholderia vietnamiensis]|uniref:acyltransferase family protein n=1 Tax=Burkholderia vietnamiensis TaxID=60552 RepID=UPI001B9D852D|nr:acyltransferase [Burkholderia vietnamiensis]MBR8007124.1 acyltransferase [Burkholderia vietnamiensis]
MEQSKRLGGLQSLRGIAALAVVFQHVTFYVCSAKGIDYAPYLRIDFGQIGVQTFFVLSGFVMAGCMSQGRAFLWHRALRIYPAFWLAILVTGALLINPVFGWHLDLRSIFLLPSSELNNSYRIPYWTLVYEVTFYVVTYAIVLTGGKRIATGVCITWLALIVAGSKYLEIQYFSPGALILLSKWNVYFIAGMLTALNTQSLRRVPSLALALAVIAGWSIGDSFSQVGSDLILALAFSSLVVLATRAPQMKLAERFGDFSFGVYLLHPPVVVLFLEIIKPHVPSMRLSVLWCSAMAVTLLGSTSFGWGEHTLYGILKKATRPRRLSTIKAAD